MNIDKVEIENRNNIISIIEKIPFGIPKGWKRIDISIGGLMYIGFSEKYTDKLICISSQGQSVINCKTGEINFCNENYDELNLTAASSELGDEVVHIAGIGGGGLRHYSSDENILEAVAPFYPKFKVVFMPNFKSYISEPEECIIIFEDYELRAFGFSRCGKYMAAASASDLSIFKKD